MKSLQQGVTKRCRLFWLTNSALVYEPKCGGQGGGGGVAGSQPMSTTVHMEHKYTLEILTPYLTYGLQHRSSKQNRQKVVFLTSLEAQKRALKELDHGVK
jgi:hypothetical protein